MQKYNTSKQPETIDNNTLKVIPTPKQINLKTLGQIRFEMSKVYRQAKSGNIETQDGTRLIYMLSQIAKMIELSELEERLELLEKHNE